MRPGDKAWSLAKAYALQGVAHHALFVVHPTLHFPMNSVNAITKSAVPMIRPLFQALLPHRVHAAAGQRRSQRRLDSRQRQGA